MKRYGMRFWLESALALVSGALLVLTMMSRGWIENVLHIDPDAGSGAAEWLLVGTAVAVLIASVTLAGREWRRREGMAVESTLRG